MAACTEYGGRGTGPVLRTIKGHGVTVTLEDDLEFDLRPPFPAVCNARTASEAATALLKSMDQLELDLQQVDVPNFDAGAFLRDLQEFLERVATRGLDGEAKRDPGK